MEHIFKRNREYVKIFFFKKIFPFFNRAFDQVRMAGISGSNIKINGSHSGVSIGEDGASQMALEDLAMFRNLAESVALYPSDPVAAERAVELSLVHKGFVYIRTTRMSTPVKNLIFLLAKSYNFLIFEKCLRKYHLFSKVLFNQEKTN